MELSTRTLPRSLPGRNDRAVDQHLSIRSREPVPSRATRERWIDPSIAVGVYDDHDDSSSMYTASMMDEASSIGTFDMDWPLPPASHPASPQSQHSTMSYTTADTSTPTESHTTENNDEVWPLPPPRSPARGRPPSALSLRSTKFHPHSAAAIQALVSTPSWPLPEPVPRISFDQRRRLPIGAASPPASPIWPLPPNVKRLTQSPVIDTTVDAAAGAPNTPHTTRSSNSWDDSHSDSRTNETGASSVEMDLPPLEQKESNVCVVSPDDWMLKFYEDSSGSDTATDDCPDRATLAAVNNIPIFDSTGQSRTFGSLYETENATHQRQLVIFIRHFYCGGCQSYIQALAESISMHEYFKIPIPTKIVVIGCGQPSMINYYRNFTQCPFPIYAEPSRKLFRKLGMHVTANLGMRSPEYMKGVATIPWLANQVKSIHNGLWNDPSNPLTLKDVFRGGNIMQVGGEFLFEDGQVLWCHRMRNYRNHAELPILRKLLEID